MQNCPVRIGTANTKNEPSLFMLLLLLTSARCLGLESFQDSLLLRSCRCCSAAAGRCYASVSPQLIRDRRAPFILRSDASLGPVEAHSSCQSDPRCQEACYQGIPSFKTMPACLFKIAAHEEGRGCLFQRWDAHIQHARTE